MAEPRQSLPVNIDLEIDLRDVMLPGHRGYDEDGEPVPAPRSVEEALFEAAAVSLANKAIEDKEGRQAYRETLRDRAREILEQKINERAGEMVEQALDQSFQPTNQFGQPTGDPITFQEYVTTRIEKWLHEQDPTDKSAMGGRRRTNIEGIISNAIDTKFRQKLNEQVNKGRDEVLGTMREKASEIMAETMTRLSEGKRPR